MSRPALRRLRRMVRAIVMLGAVAVIAGLGWFVVSSSPEDEVFSLQLGFTSVSSGSISVTERFDGTVRFDGSLTIVHATGESTDGDQGGTQPSQTGQGGAGNAADPVSVGGVITWVAPVGTEVSSGDELYRVGTDPVILLEGVVPLFRDLDDGTEGIDVAQLQAALIELGFDPDGEIEIDGVFGGQTQELVEQWQAITGAEIDGVVHLGEVVIRQGTSRITSVSVDVGDEVSVGAAVLELASADRIVQLDVEPEAVHLFALGAEVDVRLPDREVVPGTVVSVASAVDAETGLVSVLVASEGIGAVSDQAPVAILIEQVLAEQVLVVESEAILSTTSLGYALEIVNPGGSTTRVPVEVGATDGIVVEVRGDGIAAGVRVVAPV